MTGMSMDKEHWGAQRLESRKRGKRWIRGAMVLLAIAFGIWAPLLVPPGTRTPEIKFSLITAYTLAIMLGGYLLWRRDDEFARRRTLNIFAAMGLTGFVLAMIVMAAAPVFHLHNPTMIVWVASCAVGALVALTQWMRER